MRDSLTGALSRISWQTAAVLIAVIAAIVIVWVTSPDHRSDILAALGTIGALLLAVMRPMMRGPALALLVVLGAPGCAPTTLQLHARVYAFAAVTVEASQSSLVRACTVLRDGCAGETVCLERARASSTDAATAQDAARDAVDLYDRVIVAAELAGGDVGVMGQVLAALGIAAAAWEALGRTLDVVGAPLPDLPAWASALFVSASGGVS